jgi:hypothetical protein
VFAEAYEGGAGGVHGCLRRHTRESACTSREKRTSVSEVRRSSGWMFGWMGREAAGELVGEAVGEAADTLAGEVVGEALAEAVGEAVGEESCEARMRSISLGRSSLRGRQHIYVTRSRRMV